MDDDGDETRIIIFEDCLNPFATKPEESEPIMKQAISLPLQVLGGTMHMEALSILAKSFEGTDEFTKVCGDIHYEAQKAKTNRVNSKGYGYHHGYYDSGNKGNSYDNEVNFQSTRITVDDVTCSVSGI